MSRPDAPHPDDLRGAAHPIDVDDARSDDSTSFSENFDIDVLDTDARLKFKKRLGPIRLGANCTFDCPRKNGTDHIDWTFTVRPAFPRQNLATTILNKVSVQPRDSKVSWSPGTLSWKFAKLKLEGSYNWEMKRPTYDFRVMTALSNDSDTAFHKKTVAWNNRLKVQPRYDWDLSLPSVQGGNQKNTKVDPFMIRFGLKVVDLVVNLDRRPDSFFDKRRAPGFNPLGSFGEPDAKLQIITIGRSVRPTQAQQKPDLKMWPLQNQEVAVTAAKDKPTPQETTLAKPMPKEIVPPIPAKAKTAVTDPALPAVLRPTRPILAPEDKKLAKERVWSPLQRFLEEHSIRLPWMKSRE